MTTRRWTKRRGPLMARAATGGELPGQRRSSRATSSWLYDFEFSGETHSGHFAIVHTFGERGRGLEDTGVGGPHSVDKRAGVFADIAVEDQPVVTNVEM